MTPLGPFSTTADGSCPVELIDGATAYVKPRPAAARNLTVAREKIASDLGYLLGLPVAPVVVRLPEGTAWPHHSALSLAMLPAARQWGTGGQKYLSEVAEVLEELRVFWTWIGDSDHNDHAGNLLYAVKSSRCDVLAIDHSWSLCHGNQKTSLDVGVCLGYGTARMPESGTWARAMHAKILSLEWGKVENVVRRLQPILSGDEQDRMLLILQERRDHLATFLGL